MSKQTQANRIEPNQKHPNASVVLFPTLLKANAILLQHRESHKHGAQHDCQAPCSAGLESRGAVLAGRAVGAGVRVIAAGVACEDGVRIVGCAGCGLDGLSASSGSRGCVVPLGVAGTARVVLSTRRGTRVASLAVLNALVAPFLADVVGNSQGVLRHVGLLVVAANAAVGEGFLEG